MNRFEEAAHDLESNLRPALSLLRLKLGRMSCTGDERALAALAEFHRLEQHIDDLIEDLRKEPLPPLETPVDVE